MAYNPYDRRPRMDEDEGSLNQIFAELLRERAAMQAAQEARLLEQSKTFNPMKTYRELGPNRPYISGQSPIQRFRDMMLRQRARQESAKAAVDQVKAQQAAQAAEEARIMAKSTGSKTSLDLGYGPGSVSFGPKTAPTRMNGMEGGDLDEFFQRSVNAGSPNATALRMAPEPGYQGIPWNAPRTVAAIAPAPVPTVAPVAAALPILPEEEEEVIVEEPVAVARPNVVGAVAPPARVADLPKIQGFSPLEEAAINASGYANSLWENSSLGRALSGLKRFGKTVRSGLDLATTPR